MAIVEAAGQSAALPPINYLDIEKIKQDEEADYQGKHTAPPLASPPPTSRTILSDSPARSSQTGPTGSMNGFNSPPESRRTSGDEHEPAQPPRQSLPSIHEALGAEKPLYPPTSTARAPASQYPQSPRPPSSHSPPTHAKRSFTDYAQSEASQQPARSPHLTQQPSDYTPKSDPSGAAAQSSKLPALHPIQTDHPTSSDPARQHQPPPPYLQHPPPHPSPSFEPAPRSGGAMNPPAYGYSAYPQHSYSAGNAPPPASYTAPSSYPTPSSGRYPPAWRSESVDDGRNDDSKRVRLTGSTYGESVKRHLETFDVEASLNEIKDRASAMLMFAQRYSRPNHSPNGRSETILLPSLTEVDEYAACSRHVQDSFDRIRQVVLAQQTSLAAEHAQENRFKPTNRYEADELMRQRQQQHHQAQAHSAYIEEQKAGPYGASDPKKRRARAAPPGRCHSCKRSETPEWRRGPDGARTLCNACGLHYAKLTKKMGTNKAALGSSSLRPKSASDGASAM